MERFSLLEPYDFSRGKFRDYTDDIDNVDDPECLVVNNIEFAVEEPKLTELLNPSKSDELAMF